MHTSDNNISNSINRFCSLFCSSRHIDLWSNIKPEISKRSTKLCYRTFQRLNNFSQIRKLFIHIGECLCKHLSALSPIFCGVQRFHLTENFSHKLEFFFKSANNCRVSRIFLCCFSLSIQTIHSSLNNFFNLFLFTRRQLRYLTTSAFKLFF